MSYVELVYRKYKPKMFKKKITHRTAIYTAGLALYVKILFQFDIPTNIAFLDHRKILLKSYYIDAGMGHWFYDYMWNRSDIYSISM